MASSKIATAYVQVMPSMEGVAPAVKEAFTNEGSKAGNLFSGKFATALKVGIGAAATGAGVILKEALSEGASLEQSIGGIETLFGAGGKSLEEYAASVGKTTGEVRGEYNKLMLAEQEVFNNAKEAYKTAGLSANEYMETVTSFSASLISSLGGDTAKAASVADMALIDISDNANKMGSETESLIQAYQGFAKGQYQLLDNLKLGYGGTKTEMERLLADAQKLTGVEYNIDNLADVYSAIHAIQEEMGITGTTAAEASTTLIGSFNSMKAAAQNVLGNLALGEPLEESLQALGETVSTFLNGNLLPMAGNVLSALPGLLESGIIAMGEWIGNPSNVAGVIKAVAGFGWEMIGALWSAIQSAFGSIYDGWSGLFAPLTTDFDIQLSTGAIPGHKSGLDYVPYDNYLARLHEGEMVLTRSQANAYRNGQTGGGVVVNQYIYSEAKTAADLMAAARYKQEEAVMFGL